MQCCGRIEMKFYIETYGCTANQGNSSQVKDELAKLGHTPSCLEEADVVIVNTCAVTERTERKIIRRLRQLQGYRLVIAGCLPASIPGSLEGINCLKRLGVLHRSDIGEILSTLAPEDRSTRETLAASGEHAFRENACGIINISEGCRGRCSYCIVRKARGRLLSRPLEDVVESAKRLIASGAIEIQLAAQDTAAYGYDIGTNLPELLREISRIPGSHKIRVGMMKPDMAMPILEDLAEAFNSPRIYKFLHMPLQSGSDRVLAEMGRGYSADDFEKAVSSFREALDEIFITTDVIAGFPSESEEDFDSTFRLIKKIEPDKLNVTRFSARPGTEAAKLHDMPDRFKKDRSRKITKLWMDIAARRNRRYEGRTIDALVTERGRGNTMKARSDNYSGIVIAGKPRLGCAIKVRIIRSNPFYITGIAQARPAPIATCTPTSGDKREI
jgi:threonylcarbamoyladenosine tRNA methylthiotransferase CDKAL1